MRAILLAIATAATFGRTATFERAGPAAGGVLLAFDPAHDGACAMDDQLAQIDVTALTDPEQALAPAGGMLSRDQPKPGRQSAPVAKQANVLADSGQQASRRFQGLHSFQGRIQTHRLRQNRRRGLA